ANFDGTLGAVPEELRKVAAFCEKHDLILVSDEIHNDLVFPGQKHTVMANAAPEIANRLVMLTASTKTFNIAGAHIGNVIIATMTREMGPFMTAIILTASVGSAMAAEIGTMTVSEEVDALQMMSISPVKFLVMPRVVAMAIMVPIMTVYTNALGTLGGGVVANYQLQVSWEVYYSHVLESLHFKAVYTGLLKSFIFGLIISGVSCAQGLRATNGALGVGKATREAVVISFLMVLIIGYFITAVFYGKE
ncbi:MAG TPA: aminotransferase class I/II-fold pyridoxal phosphate-dependent enzyme, partial [Spirochaetota bacterium]|nr:aminotransferase class I/II-fold pyridoxal phosphate-dependent enzyme [Spirochaetota bacterium]